MPTSANDTLTPVWSITLASSDPVARFAAQELRRTLQRIGAPPLPIVSVAADAVSTGPRIALTCGEHQADDGFVRTPDADGLTLRADSPRGLLYAVYDLLETLGCRWVAPGPTGEYLPRHEQITLPRMAVAQRPALPGRCLIIGHDFFLDDAEEWIIWAARNRLNTIFIHTINARPALGACHLRRWHARRHELLPLLRARGMLLELGGHGMPDLVPRRFFRQNPEMFRYDGTRRTPDYNFCISNSDTRRMLRRQGAAFFKAHPEAQILHLWPDDLLGGGWCHCPRCAGLSAADQALLATNELAEVLEELQPQARLAYLAYHDTTAPPARIAPRPNVVLAYAPRPRSYAHGIADTTSRVNTPLWQALTANLDLFRPPTAGQEQHVFEYYLDGILFKSTPPPLPEVLQADLRAYREAGVHTVQALMTGDRPWLAAPLNAYLFARLAWEPEQNPQELLQQYAAVRASRTPEALVAAYNALTDAWRPALDFLPEEQSLAGDMPTARRNLFAHPPMDVLDYMTAPRSLRERRLELLAATDTTLAAGRLAWDCVLAQAHADTNYLRAEQAEWELGAQVLHFIMVRQRLYVLAERRPSRAVLSMALQTAREALHNLVCWGEYHLPTAHGRSNYRLMRMSFQLHLETLHDQRLARPWERVWLRIDTYRQLAWLLWRVARR